MAISSVIPLLPLAIRNSEPGQSRFFLPNARQITALSGLTTWSLGLSPGVSPGYPPNRPRGGPPSGPRSRYPDRYPGGSPDGPGYGSPNG